MTDAQKLMAVLIENALGHFAHEEHLFEQFGFPDLASHAHAHDRLATKLIGLKQDFDATNLNRKWLEVCAMLRSLLLDHILHDDMKYRDFLHQSRLLPTA